MKTKILVSVLIIFLLAFGAYKYLYQSHRNFEEEKSLPIISAINFLKFLKENEIAANQKYLNKVIESNGTITSLDVKAKTITIDGLVFASFNEMDLSGLKINAKINYKGRFIGYDELLEEIKLDNCVIIN